MSALYVPAGLVLVVLFAIVWLADLFLVRRCSRCGQDSTWPYHFACRKVLCNNHHRYQTTDWPYGVLTLGMLVVVLSWLVVG